MLWFNSIGRKLDQILTQQSQLLAALTAISQKEDKLMAALDDLKTAVAAEDTVIGSAVTLLNGIGAALAAAGTDPVALEALKTDIANQTQALSAAVAAGTAAEAAPASPPPPAS